MKLYILSFSFILLMSCSKKPEINLDADEMYLVAYDYSYPDIDSDEEYDWKFECYKFSEIQSDFSTQIFLPKNYRGNFYKEDKVLSDSLKRDINRIIAKYPNDSIFTRSDSEEPVFLYCGPTYVFIIKKGNQSVSLTGLPFSYPQDLRNVLDSLDVEIDFTKPVVNQDSIKSILKTIEQQIDRPDLPLPLKNSVKFTPPVINEDY